MIRQGTGNAASLAELARLRTRAVRYRLGPGPPPEVMLRAVGAPVCLVGAWAGGGAILADDPLVVLTDAGTDEVLAALDVAPVVVGTAEDGTVGGGWFGWIGYDGGSQLAFHDHLLRYLDGHWWFEALASDERDALLVARREEAAALLASGGRPASEDGGAPVSAGVADGGVARGGRPAAPRWGTGAFGGADATVHLAAVERAVELIRAGEIYQVNVCTRLAAPFRGDPAALFADAASSLRPAFGAYVRGESGALASFSPELFLRRRGREVRTSPIKGTWPRAEGTAGAQQLRSSAKDAAENVMIVDLMRNDLGRVCEVGSVRVETLLDVQAHPGVWHLVSTIAGTLRTGVGDADVLRASFPPGSVTGAPKAAAVRAITELESTRRGVYTGAIGFVSPVWGAEFSVAIRTFELTGGRIELGVGGGVTADSVPMLEWRECLHKVAPLLAALGASLTDEVSPRSAPVAPVQPGGGLFETLLAIDGRVLSLADHVARLDRSCRELYSAGLPEGVADDVRAAAAGTTGSLAIRIAVSAQLQVGVSATPAPARPAASVACTVRGRSGLWRHKWADRSYLDAAEGAGVPLFVAADGTVLETSRGNVFLLCADGTLVTAPLRDDLLPGVTRRALLDLARDEGRRSELRPFGLDELRATPAFWTSSLSLAVPIASVDGIDLPRADAVVAGFAHALTGGSRTVR